jgi:hypothetical protein
MRNLLRTMCAVALVGCSDAAQHSTELATSTSAADSRRVSPPGLRPDTILPPHHIDPRSPVARLEALVSANLTPVAIPADLFSRSSDAVHPDMACPPAPWNGQHCWLMYTPYLNSDPSYENPSFVYAQSETTWATPPGITNPVVPWPGLQKYNSDPDHAYDPATHRLVQLYRLVADGYNKIMLMSTTTGRQWTTAVLAFQELNHDAVSPALIIEPDEEAKVWYVKTGSGGCQTTASSVVMRTTRPAADSSFERAVWSDAVPVNLSIPGYNIWHLDVAKLPGQAGYVAFIAAFPKGTGCANNDLWLATSPDGITWRSYALPVLWRSMRFAKTAGLTTWYRGTLRYDAETDSLHLWPSALVGSRWNVYHTSVPLDAVLGLLRSTDHADLAATSLASLPVNPTRIPMP